MDRKPVTSSQIAAIGYDPATKTLEVEFTTKKPDQKGSVYQYSNVTPEDHNALITAKSLGSHFIKVIKPNAEKFPFQKITEPTEPAK